MTTSTLLQVKSTFFSLLGEQYSGTATGGSTAKLTDSSLAILAAASETWPTPIEKRQLRITSGAASGDLKLVAKPDRTLGDLFPVPPPFSGAVGAADTYELWGNAIHGGAMLTALANRCLRRLRPVQSVQITIVTGQTHYAVTTQVPTRRDIRSVYVRDLDASGLQPYRRRNVRWDAEDTGSTPAVTLVLDRPLTFNTAVNELWIEYHGSLTPFVNDLSTVDANYGAAWLPWEMVYEFARQQATTTTADTARWKGLVSLALESDHLPAERNRWEPREVQYLRDGVFRKSA